MLAGYHWWQYGQAVWEAIYLLLVNPLFYIGALLLLWDAIRRARQQKGFFGFRTNGVWRPLFALLLLSLGIGSLLSIANLLVGIVIRPGEVWVTSALVVLLGLVRLRYAASIYGIAVFLVGALVFRTFSGTTGVQPIDWLLATFRHASIFSWVVLAAGLSLAEWLFFLLRRTGEVGPALQNSGRGRAIGAVILQNSAILPVIALQPGALQIHPHIFWNWPLGNPFLHSFSLIALPLLFGFNGLFAALSSTQVVRMYRRYQLALGILLVGTAYCVYQFSEAFVLVAVLVIIVLRELVTWHLLYREVEGDALYPVSQEGVRVLGVVPNSVAAAMGLKAGEVITKINQVPVHSAYDLHFALDQNPAYAKLEVLDANGELRIVGKPVYTGERSKLGLVLLPEQHGGKVFTRIRCGWAQTMYLKKRQLPDGNHDYWRDLDSVSISE